MRQSPPLPIQTLMNEFLRIEANDLEVLTELPGVLPIRSGEGVMGYAKIDREAYRRDLYALVLPDAEPYKVRSKKLPLAGAGLSLCFFCNRCSGWRKRLFFSDQAFGPGSLPFANRLECKECLVSAEGRNLNLGCGKRRSR
jgi:hypothetical protein